MSVLEVKNVSIRYMTGDFKDIGLKEYLLRRLTGRYQATEFWADRNIRFSLEQGDMLGIIGANGAGKSTLLKAITGIMEPTQGSVRREGNVAALLELASGFDKDLTVKENAYLRGAMLGYTRAFMDETYEQIIDFAELRGFEDRPFKQLSSGMKARLAFSIASLVRPDILILDEVLSVGDGAFRKKSEEKMREIIAGGATTILVSHSLQQIREMCNKILWLHKGEQIAFGDNVRELCDHYEQFLGGRSDALTAEHLWRFDRFAWEEGEAGLQASAVFPCAFCGNTRSVPARVSCEHEADGRGYVYTASVSADESVDAQAHTGRHSRSIADENGRRLRVSRIAAPDTLGGSLLAARELQRALAMEQLDTVLIASALSYPDALSASYLSALRRAPLLLCDATAAGEDRLLAWLREALRPGGEALLVGGEREVARSLAERLRGQGFAVRRIAGEDSAAVNLALLREAGLPKSREVLVCAGKSYTDMLVGSACRRPLLAISDTLSEAQERLLSEWNDCRFTIIGGSFTVSEALEEQLSAYGLVERLAGASRYESAVLAARRCYASPERAVLVSSRDFREELFAGAMAAMLEAPLLPVDTGKGRQAADYLAGFALAQGYAVGSRKQLGDAAVLGVFSLASADQITALGEASANT